jgi:hypothetical protein
MRGPTKEQEGAESGRDEEQQRWPLFFPVLYFIYLFIYFWVCESDGKSILLFPFYL